MFCHPTQNKLLPSPPLHFPQNPSEYAQSFTPTFNRLDNSMGKPQLRSISFCVTLTGQKVPDPFLYLRVSFLQTRHRYVTDTCTCHSEVRVGLVCNLLRVYHDQLITKCRNCRTRIIARIYFSCVLEVPTPKNYCVLNSCTC